MMAVNLFVSPEPFRACVITYVGAEIRMGSCRLRAVVVAPGSGDLVGDECDLFTFYVDEESYDLPALVGRTVGEVLYDRRRARVASLRG